MGGVGGAAEVEASSCVCDGEGKREEKREGVHCGVANGKRSVWGLESPKVPLQRAKKMQMSAIG